jgi:hypothetical protein
MMQILPRDAEVPPEVALPTIVGTQYNPIGFWTDALTRDGGVWRITDRDLCNAGRVAPLQAMALAIDAGSAKFLTRRPIPKESTR